MLHVERVDLVLSSAAARRRSVRRVTPIVRRRNFASASASGRVFSLIPSRMQLSS